jgi:protein-disulfide isomerase
MEPQQTNDAPPIETIKPNPKIQPFLTPIAVIIAGVIIALAVKSGGGIKPSTDPSGGAQAQVNIKDVAIKDHPFVGKESAKVTIAYWSDYQCPFCKQFETQTMPSIIKDYVDTGKAKIVFKDYQFLGPDSETGALYARAVWELYPKQFFAWREAMFNKQDNENGGFGTEATVLALTKTIAGIDGNKVAQTVAAKKATYQQAIEDDRTEGANFGINGTPGFIIGTTAIPGSVPYATFKQLIDQQL